jgi:hypothetical protein
MASSREAQGYQIAVIIFAVLPAVLAITTYVFYSQSETNKKELVDIQAKLKQADASEKKHLYRELALMHVLGVQGVDEARVDAAKGATGEDPEIATIRDQFKKDMEMFGSEVAAEGQSRNYRTLPGYLLGVISKRNVDVSVKEDAAKKLLSEKTAFEKSESARAKKAEDTQKLAEDDLKEERVKFNDERAKIVEANKKLAADLASKERTYKESEKKTSEERKQLEAQVVAQTKLNAALKTKNKPGGQFESPDGKITWVNQQLRLVWINVGEADGLQRQTTFSVYNHDQAGVIPGNSKKEDQATRDASDGGLPSRAAVAKPKARIEVLRITGPHVAECRILDNDIANPIMPNDLIHTPVWSPNQEVHFALAGFMDVDNDGTSDRELVRRIIELNGGRIDYELKDDGTVAEDKLSINTRYLVLGTKPTERTGQGVLAEYNNLMNKVEDYNIEELSVQKLLAMMGWKAEEKKIDYRSAKDLSAFPARQPGAGKGGAGGDAAAPGAAPAPKPAPQPAPPAEDPFK